MAGNRQLECRATRVGHFDEDKPVYPTTIDRVVILGVEIGITEVLLEHLDSRGGTSGGRVIPQSNYTWDGADAVLNISAVNASVMSPFRLVWTI